jgi:hypothetical protein
VLNRSSSPNAGFARAHMLTERCREITSFSAPDVLTMGKEADPVLRQARCSFVLLPAASTL